MHEIITLQLGQQANYLGTHFWNAQEAYFTYDEDTVTPVDHDVHFRSGIGVGGVETFTPRALIYDLKGGFGTMKKINALYDGLSDGGQDLGPETVWNRGRSAHVEPAIEKIRYQKDLDEGVFPPAQLNSSDVRYWSDFNRVFYHPRSSVQLTDYELDSTLQPFEQFDLGVDLYKQLDREHDLLDRDFRLFAEECDQMQGIQLLTTSDNGWAGFASKYIEDLRDEFGKIPIFVWGLEDRKRLSRDAQLVKSVSHALALSRMVPLASVYIPLSNPPMAIANNISVSQGVPWHSSALLSAAMETSILATRMKINISGRISMGGMAAFLDGGRKQNIAMLTMEFAGREESGDIGREDNGSTPKPIQSSEKVTSCSWEYPKRAQKKPHVFAEYLTTRGFAEQENTEPELDDDDNHKPLRTRFGSSLEYPIVDSFPKILPVLGFDETTNRASCAVETVLSTNTNAIYHVTNIRDCASRFIGVDEREMVVNDLDEIIDAFQDGWSGDSDWDDEI